MDVLDTDRRNYDNIDRRCILDIICANCGKYGHMYRSCTEPVTSFGIICFTYRHDFPEFIMIQRKDSLSYVEFIRGKYSIHDYTYLPNLFSGFSIEERYRILKYDFDTMWSSFWRHNQFRNHYKEYERSLELFNCLKNGVYDSDGNFRYNLESLINETIPIHEDTEFGFPKGRRNINESDIGCAVREFSEETGISRKCVKIIGIAPVEELFIGTNKTKYRHKYFIAQLLFPSPKIFKNINCIIPARTQVQKREIKSIALFDYDNVIQHIHESHSERIKLFNIVYQEVIRLKP